MHIKEKSLISELKNKGIRPSYQRVKVLEFLYQVNSHLTADMIYRSLLKEIPTLSKATIYNSLHSFVDAGLIRVINIDDDEMRYDVVLADHGHFKCDSCGSIYNFAIDINSVPFDELNQFQVNEKNVYFKGLCPNCVDQHINNERK